MLLDFILVFSGLYTWMVLIYGLAKLFGATIRVNDQQKPMCNAKHSLGVEYEGCKFDDCIRPTERAVF